MHDVLDERSGAERWERCLDRVARAVVSVRIDGTRPFDTEWNETAQATAFVVDHERGLMLTNRHVVRSGPTVAEAVFLNHEEVPLRAVYRDPVHDFGFFRFDPARLRFMEPVTLHLAPEKARVGTEIRVVGNDAGEKLSILAGTLARLDRPAPNYGQRRYNDFNTFYIQAASSTSGGSSGSPVVDRIGDVVALNAGSRTQAASSFFLPLERVVRALRCIQREQPITRGTLMTTFLHTPFDELRRLGLTAEREAAARARDPGGTGLLVVAKILPGGPADQRLELGDVLININGQPLTHFVALEELLDERVGETLTIELDRGGTARTVELRVADLHAITPRSYLSVGGAILHDLSYQRARAHDVPLRGVYVANTGYLFTGSDLERDAVVLEIDGQPTPDLDAMQRALEAIPQGAPVKARSYSLEAPARERLSLFTMDRKWFGMQRAERDEATGLWPPRPCPPPPPNPPLQPVSATYPGDASSKHAELARALVYIDARLPFKLDGIHRSRFRGAGVVVDRARGLVVCDQNTVPLTLADVHITFAGSVELPGEIVLVHPLHNIAVVRYDPAAIGETPVTELPLAATPAKPGDSLTLVALKKNLQVLTQSADVTTIEPLELPVPQPPRFREANLDRISISSSVKTIGGLLADQAGEAVALWSNFSYQLGKDHRVTEHGTPISLVQGVLEALHDGLSPEFLDPGAEFQHVSLARARRHGLPDEAARRLEAHDSDARNALQVARICARCQEEEGAGWRPGDIVLAVDGRPATRFHEVERALTRGPVEVELLRDGALIKTTVRGLPISGAGTDRVLHWAGALLQAPHRAVMMQRGIPPAGVYISLYWYGSPASRSKMRAARMITEVDGRPTPDLDAFLEVVRGRPNRASLRVKTLDLEGKSQLQTLRLDLDYFPTYEFRRDARGWLRVDHP
ncbi:MAG: trypsin-like peptidase domain-containing protein [Myxococcales bacterium]|nr:trypsin-like peptidase domain-containing protein [Myxococcales bacterium]MCB9756092.1 trypsin-like peptidase domain-containing protein [Myxococcales bacterium]